MAKWKEHLAYNMETERMKKAIQDIVDDNKNRKIHGEPWVDEGPCPSCLDNQCQCGPDDDDWLDEIDDDGCRTATVKAGYHDLFDVLREALEQAQDGKGAERHGNGLSFTEQPALTITRAVGLGFPLGQAMKKIQESQRMDTDAAKRELLGAINYLAAAVLFLDENAD